jgi:hypothetical protein
MICYYYVGILATNDAEFLLNQSGDSFATAHIEKERWSSRMCSLLIRQDAQGNTPLHWRWNAATVKETAPSSAWKTDQAPSPCTLTHFHMFYNVLLKGGDHDGKDYLSPLVRQVNHRQELLLHRAVKFGTRQSIAKNVPILVGAYPMSASIVDRQTRLFPFMAAAEGVEA